MYLIIEPSIYRIFGCTDPSDIRVIRDIFNLIDVKIVNIIRLDR